MTTAASRPLIVRVRNWIGDVVMGLPALRLLEQHGYSLHIIARGGWAPSLLSGYGWPVHVQPKKLFERVAQLKRVRDTCAALDLGFRARENALVLPQSFSSALEMRLAGLKAVGYGQEGRSPLLARAEKITYGGSALVAYWDLACLFLRIQASPPPSIDMSLHPDSVRKAETLLADHGIRPGFLMVCPFAGGLATAKKLDKKWPGFAEYVREAGAAFGRDLVVCPGPTELEEAKRLYPSAKLMTIANLGDYAAVLQRAALVVANDTGPAHMAAAVGAPVLSVLGPTIVEQWAPWGPQVRVLKHPQPEHGPSVWPTVAEVMAETRRLLATG
ncbi:MAG: glycosyltransferase family 9 protein [Pseudomonadota bacterium]